MESATNRRDIICPECPDIYAETEITGYRGEESKPLVDILGSSTRSDKQREANNTARLFKRLLTREPKLATAETDGFSLAAQKSKLANIDRLKDWQFKCPAGHFVDGNRGQQLPIAVVGPSGASKSHFLPGLIWETGLRKALGPLGVSLRAAQFTSSGLDFAVTQVYKHKLVLAPTPPDQVTGPFGYRLSIQRGADETRHSLLLFDVGGEALSTIVKISEQAAFVLLCQAIFVLIDPQELMSTNFDDDDHEISDREQVIAAAHVRDGISRIADTLEELWDGSMREIPVPVCFVIAKADSINWVYEWDRETAIVVDAARKGEELREALTQSSERARSQFAEFGGQLIVDEIAERFDPNRVRFTAASATSEMPVFPESDEENVAGSWEEPTPEGISLALLHLLDLLGKLETTTTGDDERRVR